MPKLQSLKDALLGSEDAEKHQYECRACNARFTSTESNMQRVSCPQCGGHRVKEPVTTLG